MNHVIAGLIEIENKAREVYALAATKFNDDPGLQNFFLEMAESEREHCEILLRALHIAEMRPDIAPVVCLDKSAKEHILAEIAVLEAAISEDAPLKEAVMDAVVIMETLEWNEVFACVMNVLKRHYREFIGAAQKIQAHKEHVEAFLASRPAFSMQYAAMMKLPDAWQDNILVVDEDGVIADIMEVLFTENGAVVRAADASAAIERLKQEFFAAIVCDADMTEMNGIEFYRSASELAPNIRERILFLSDCTNAEHMDFFKKKNMRVLRKPATISEIKKLVSALCRPAS